jgi:hypothetical protein
MRLTGNRGSQVEKKRIAMALVAGGVTAATAGGVALWGSQEREPGSAARAATTSAEPVAAPDAGAQLPTRAAIGKARGQPFDALSWAPAPKPTRIVAAPPPKPVAPPVPYRIAGQVMHDGLNQVVLARDDRVFTVGEGEILDNTYRIEAIRPEGVTIVYLPLQERQQIQVAGLLLESARALALAGASAPPSAAAAPASAPRAAGNSGPAQLRWEGPKQVHAGANFDVTLKLKSAQPVQALPLQLNYDAKLLEPVAVRPGGMFDGGRFSYRVNPTGAIFVGASTSEAAPADADLMVVTFRPIRSGDAELRVSAVALQGAAGRAVAHEPPAAFRTAILQ